MKRNIIYLLILPLVWLAGCSKAEEGVDSPKARPGSEVQFTVGFVDEAINASESNNASSSSDKAKTRAATDAVFNTTWTDGDEIGVFAYKAGSTADADKIAANIKLVRTAGTWAAASDADKVYYPVDGSKLDFYAYYPYKDNGGSPQTLDPAAIAFSVKADQSTAADYSLSDQMTAQTKDQSTAIVGLNFAHNMAMVQVTVDKKTPVPTFRDGEDGFTVTLKGAKLATSGIDLTAATPTTAVDGTAAATDIMMYRVEQPGDANYVTSYTYRALVPSQQLEAGQLFGFGQALQGNVISMRYSLSVAVTPAAAKATTYKVTLDYDLDPTHVYKIGDAYPYKGIPVGVVFWVDDTDQSYEATAKTSPHGKFVSLDEHAPNNGQDLYGIPWDQNDAGDDWGDFDTQARDLADGRANMATIKSWIGSLAATTAGATKGWSNFPPFAWVDLKNGAQGTTTYASGQKEVWYLPAKDELERLHSVWNGSPTAFNGKITAAGGMNIATTDSYWSSTEGVNFSAWAVNFKYGISGAVLKDYKYRVRAIQAF